MPRIRCPAASLGVPGRHGCGSPLNPFPKLPRYSLTGHCENGNIDAEACQGTHVASLAHPARPSVPRSRPGPRAQHPTTGPCSTRTENHPICHEPPPMGRTGVSARPPHRPGPAVTHWLGDRRAGRMRGTRPTRADTPVRPYLDPGRLHRVPCAVGADPRVRPAASPPHPVRRDGPARPTNSARLDGPDMGLMAY
jgi:hypothetical protein